MTEKEQTNNGLKYGIFEPGVPLEERYQRLHKFLDSQEEKELADDRPKQLELLFSMVEVHESRFEFLGENSMGKSFVPGNTLGLHPYFGGTIVVGTSWIDDAFKKIGSELSLADIHPYLVRMAICDLFPPEGEFYETNGGLVRCVRNSSFGYTPRIDVFNKSKEGVVASILELGLERDLLDLSEDFRNYIEGTGN